MGRRYVPRFTTIEDAPAMVGWDCDRFV